MRNLVELTEEDLLNVQKWQTATSIMIQGKMRTPYSDSETKTGDKLKHMVGQLEHFRERILEIYNNPEGWLDNLKEWQPKEAGGLEEVNTFEDVIQVFIKKEVLEEM